MINISELNGAGETPAQINKSEFKPLAFIDNGGTIMAVIAFGADRLEVPATLVSEDNAEDGRSYYSALQKAIELSVVSSNVSARRAGAIALGKMRDATGSLSELIAAGAFLCSNTQRTQIFKYAKNGFKTIAAFAAEHGVSVDYATELLKECSAYSD